MRRLHRLELRTRPSARLSRACNFRVDHLVFADLGGLYWLTIVFACGCIAAVVSLIVWSARRLNLL